MGRRLFQVVLVAAIVISLGGWFWLLVAAVRWLVKLI
jgi:hypothetical protein